jgi:outer membrane receptor protein involved in Fe transport
MLGLLTALGGAVVFLGLSSNLKAQVGTATLSGVVQDSSGAGIPGAEVELQSTTERTSRRTVADATGAYFIPALNPGTYQLVVTARGFQSQTVTGITLTTGQGTTLNVTLGVAKAITQVEVKEASPLLETTSSAVGGQVTSEQLTELPTYGRNFTTLITLLPGTVGLGSPDTVNLSFNGVGLNPSVYGQRQRSNQYTLDGVPNYEAIYSGVPIFPPPEAIAEMKVQAGMDSGAYGWAAGANVNIVTKSGTNRYHGDAWEFVQNNILNARSYFSPSVGAYRWNQFGGTFGGPLFIPHLVSKEKAWYVFGYYEGIRLHTATYGTALVPTPDELAGNFSGDPPIYNPYTSTVAPDGSLASRQPFANNQIPTNLMDQHALTFAKLGYPLPNLAPGVIPGVNYINTAPSINDEENWSVRADHQFGQKDSFYARYSATTNPTSSVFFPAFPTVGVNHYSNIAVNDTHTFNPTTVLTLRFGMAQTLFNSFTRDKDIAAAIGTQAAYPPFEGKYNTLPPTSIEGYPSLADWIGINGPQYVWSWTADTQKTKGRHSISFGAGVRRQTFFTDCQTGTFEEFTSDQTAFGPGTGDALASFLLGLPESVGRGVGKTAGDMSGNAYSFYVQDTFRATRKLTLNLGLRWDYAAPLKNTFVAGNFEWENGMYYWDQKNPITGAPANIRRGYIAPDYRSYQPRLGIAYQLTPKTVVRSGFGIFSEAMGLSAQMQQNNHGAWPSSYVDELSGLNLTLPTAFFEDPFPGPPVPTLTPQGILIGTNPYTPTSRTGYVEEWNFALQRQLTPSLMVEATYFGSHGVKLPTMIVDNVAWPPAPTPIQTRQRWPQYAPFPQGGYDEAMSWYDGLSLKLERRMSRNLTLLVDYTWSKTMDLVDSLFSEVTLTAGPYSNTSDPTRYDIGNDFKGPAGFNVRQVFNASYLYEIPAKSQNKWVNAAIAHWSLSGVISANNGTPYVAYLSSDNENIGTAQGILNEFPDLVGNPNSISPRTSSEWFNTAAYSIPAFGTAGHAGKYALYSDPEINWDSAFFKRFPFGESRDVEFRAEFFDFLNLSTFGPPGSLVGTPEFGTISSTIQGGRTIQFALKFHF